MGYLNVPFDCTSRDVAPYPDNGVKLYDSDDEGTAALNGSDSQSLESDGISRSWRRLTFGRELADGPFSKVGYYQEYYRLGARVPDRWNNHLIPPTQSRQTTGDSTYDNALHQPRCHIAGDLGALIGLCAFCSPIENTPETIQSSFRPRFRHPEYQRPPNPIPFHESK